VREAIGAGRLPSEPRPEAGGPSFRLGPVVRNTMPARDPSAGLRAPSPISRPVMQDRPPFQGRPAAVAIGTRDAGATAPSSVSRPTARTGFGAARTGFGLPSLRRNVCPHFYMTGLRGSVPIQAPHLLKALVRQDHTVSRCQLRGGVHMEEGYVNDVCLGSRFNQCVFYEDDLEL
jgi:hypothetical protein